MIMSFVCQHCTVDSMCVVATTTKQQQQQHCITDLPLSATQAAHAHYKNGNNC